MWKWKVKVFTASWRSLSCKATSLTWTLRSENSSIQRNKYVYILWTLTSVVNPLAIVIAIDHLIIVMFTYHEYWPVLCMPHAIVFAIVIVIVIDHLVIIVFIYCEHWPVLYTPLALAPPSASASSPPVGPSRQKVFRHLIRESNRCFQILP